MYQQTKGNNMELTTSRQTVGATIKTYKTVEIVHKQKTTFKGNKIAKAEKQRFNADLINERNAKLFESAKTESKASKKRSERQGKRNIKKFNKL